MVNRGTAKRHRPNDFHTPPSLDTPIKSPSLPSPPPGAAAARSLHRRINYTPPREEKMSPLRPSPQGGGRPGRGPGRRRGGGEEGSTPDPTYFVLGSRAGGCRGPWALPAEPGRCVRVSAPSRPVPSLALSPAVRFLRGAGPGG